MLTTHDHERLRGVHPTLVTDVERLCEAATTRGTPMFVAQGVRTVQQQQALYAQGRTTPGKIVTMKDGVKFPSDHQVHADGFGHAVDIAFVPTAARKDAWSDQWPWEAFGEAAEGLGLRWGGRWTHPHDLDHIELPEMKA